jgi:hypothetical protein
VQDRAAWLTVYVWPAIVSVAVRADPVFSATATVTAPDPVPLAGLAVTQVELLAAVQPQAALLADTATVLAPPAAAADRALADSPKVQDTAVWLTV